MTAADMIYAHLVQNGKATRPEMEALFHLTEKTVGTAIRKLERLGYIHRAGMTPKEHHKKRAVIFKLTDTKHDLRLVGDCRGRPHLTEATTTQTHSFDALTLVMSNFFRPLSHQAMDVIEVEGV